MGASVFTTKAEGKTAKEAFFAAVKEAQYEHGHGGYSGTIAEKTSFVLILVPSGMDPEEFAEHLIDKCDERVDDKWGPAGCVLVKPGEYLFFGWASD